ncbi:MAG: hypothetical protein LBT24_01130 [Tannerella sp.]|jgi:hypothetical protein|nr:hypothetical protein [Tannerella sp.]
MKKTIFSVAAGIIISLASCNNDASEASDNENVTGELSVVATATTYSGGEDKKIAFTGSDIKSYNTKTGELAFNKLTFEQLKSRTENFVLTFYLDDKELFNSAAIGADTLFLESETVYNDLVFVLRGDENERLYLMDGYPDLNQVENFGVNKEDARRTREENATKREAEWNIFIDYLKEAGKLVEINGITPPPGDNNTGEGIDSTNIVSSLSYKWKLAGFVNGAERKGLSVI